MELEKEHEFVDSPEEVRAESKVPRRDTDLRHLFREKKRTKFFILSGVVALVLLVAGGGWWLQRGSENPNGETGEEGIELKVIEDYAGKRVLYIDSYHEGYVWSDGITRGIESVIEPSGAELKIHRMDTKRNTSEEFKQQAALEAKAAIEKFNPDVVIVSDDNAFRYLVMEYYRDADLPFAFSGLNWDAAVYGAPYENTTGMVEVSLLLGIVDHLKQYAAGDRIGYLSADVLTERKSLQYYGILFGFEFEKEYLVATMEEWKTAYLALQDEVDIVIFENNAGIVDWSQAEAEAFALEHIKVPVGTTYSWTMGESLLGLTKVPEEQGQWSAQAALDILDGARPADIPVVTNKQGQLMLNLAMAEKLGITFAPSLLRNANIVDESLTGVPDGE